jgi:hypothetical protein
MLDPKITKAHSTFSLWRKMMKWSKVMKRRVCFYKQISERIINFNLFKLRIKKILITL